MPCSRLHDTGSAQKGGSKSPPPPQRVLTVSVAQSVPIELIPSDSPPSCPSHAYPTPKSSFLVHSSSKNENPKMLTQADSHI
jgi:hypothetical protein